MKTREGRGERRRRLDQRRNCDFLMPNAKLRKYTFFFEILSRASIEIIREKARAFFTDIPDESDKY